MLAGRQPLSLCTDLAHNKEFCLTTLAWPLKVLLLQSNHAGENPSIDLSHQDGVLPVFCMQVARPAPVMMHGGSHTHVR